MLTMAIGKMAGAKPLVSACIRSAFRHLRKTPSPVNVHPASGPCANNANSVIDQSTL
jgi:hypothetical protein